MLKFSMRYKTITVRFNSPRHSCSASTEEQWDSLEQALNELALLGWEIDHVINKTIVGANDLLFNQPILILKNLN